MFNLILTALPLWLTEPFMCLLNPDLGKRRKVKNYDASTYKTVDWEKVETTRKRDLLKHAREERKANGKFTVVVESKTALAETQP